MAVALEQFVKQLEDSGILAGDTLKDFIPPKASPKDAEELARELVRKKKLTRYQAEEVYKGKAKSLTLGNYVLMEKIGAGGMGQVFKARHRRMDRIVAVKLLPAAMTKDQAAIARFEREVKAAARISHPNIVAAFDADCANGIHFLVMELVEGSDLSALVKKNGPFPVDKAVGYVLQAARGLEAAHAEGIVHRDIKPANLLLDKKGVVKILDMGLARLSSDGEAPTAAELTSTGTVMGTVDYMAPEQALDTKTADARADIYSLGCSLFFLLTGKATYGGESLMAKLIAHREQAIPSLSAACPDAPEEVEAVFRKMLAKKIEDRYQSMTEVIADLEQCVPHPVQPASTQQLPGSSTDVGLTNLFKNSTQAPTRTAPPKKVAAPGSVIGKDRKKLLLIGGGVLGAMILLAGITVSIMTKDGTLIVEVDQPNAMVQVLDAEGKVEVSQKGGVGKITIGVDPGKHRLRVEKDGFTVFGEVFEMEARGRKTISAKLVPLQEKQPLAGQPQTSDLLAMLDLQQDRVTIKNLTGANNWTRTGQTLTYTSDAKAGKIVAPVDLKNARDFEIESKVRRLSGDGVFTFDFASSATLGTGVDVFIGGRIELKLENGQRKEIGKWPAAIKDGGLISIRVRHESKDQPGSVVVTVDGIEAAKWEGDVSKIGTPLEGHPNFPGQATVGLFCFRDSYELDSWQLKVFEGEVKQLRALATLATERFALRFNGEEDAVNVPSFQFDGTPPLTIEAWMTPEQSDHRHRNAVVVGDKDRQFLCIKTLDGKWWGLLGDMAAKKWNNEFSGMAKAGQRDHVAATWDGRQVKLYVNGQACAHFESSLDAAQASPRGGLTLGGLVGHKGTMDEVKVSRDVLYTGPFVPLDRFAVDENTLALYHFEEGQGEELRDSSGNNHHGKIVGAKWLPAKATQASGFALKFDGKSNFVATPVRYDGTRPITVEASVVVGQEVEGERNIVTDAQGSGFRLCLRSGNCVMAGNDGTTSIAVTSAAAVVPGQSLHLAGVFDGKEIRLYVDGKSQGSAALSAIKPPEGIPLLIGADPNGPIGQISAQSCFDGVIDEVRISKVARYAQDFTPETRFTPDADTHALYHFDDGSGDVLKDSSANKNHAKIVGATWVRYGESSTPSMADWRGWPADAPQPAIAPFDATQARKHQEAWAKHLGVPVEYENSIGMKFRLIPPGEFSMGSTAEEITDALRFTRGDVHWQECIKSESPRHKVILTQPLYLGVHEVTQNQYAKIMGQNPSHFAATGAGKGAVAGMETTDLPVEQASWNDAAEFCAKLSEQEKLTPFYSRSEETVAMLKGTGYRLPTEAEWEFACRAGTTTKYWIGDKDEDLPAAGWFKDNSHERIHSVGELKPNPLGLCDIHGNVWEWVQDGWDRPYYGQFQEKPAIDPTGPSIASAMRMVRGGGWTTFAPGCRAADRYARDPATSTSYIGFRVALAINSTRAAAIATGGVAGTDEWLELVTAVDPMRDLLQEAQVGKNQWENRDGALTYVSDGRAGFIRVPVELDSREVEIEVEMTPLEDNAGLSIDVPTPEHLVVFQLRTRGDGRAALSAKVPGEPVAFVKGQKSVAKLRFVSQPGAGGTAEATMTFDGKAVLAWKGKLEDVIFGPLAPGDRDLLQTRSVGLWLGNQAMAFHSIRVRAPNGKARLLYRAADSLLFFTTPAFQPWMKDVAAMPAEQQVAAVVKKLQDLNQGFDGQVTPTIENGVVTGLRFLTDNVTDISPVQALEGLKYLHCGGSDSGKGKLADLSPLKGMLLTTLMCPFTDVVDLQPLKGMPLTVLECFYTRIFDLSPLKGMSLTGLDCHMTLVSDLSPLTGMPLGNLYCWSTQVSDLSPLKEMPLDYLNCGGTKVADLSPLHGMPLSRLDILETPVSDLTPLKGMSLGYLACAGTRVSDLSPLKDLPLIRDIYLDFKPFRDTELLRSIKTLETINNKPAAEFWKEVEAKQAAFDQWIKAVAALPAEQQVGAVAKKLQDLNPEIDGKVTTVNGSGAPHPIENGVVTGLHFLADNVTDISALRALTGLELLICQGSGIANGQVNGQLSDLSPLRGVKLKYLACSDNPVSDLTPLQGMPLRFLSCSDSRVSNLSPLQGMLLTGLHVSNTSVSDISPLKGMPLKVLSLNGTQVTDLKPLKEMQLEVLGCDFTPVSDLSPLAGMPLTILGIHRTAVTDLSPLKGMKLEGLNIVGTRVTDLAPLSEVDVKSFAFESKSFRNLEPLRSIKTLETINDKPAAEFWKEVDGQE